MPVVWLDTPVDLFDDTYDGVWFDVDLSAIVSPHATGAILKIISNNATQDLIYTRVNGSSDYDTNFNRAAYILGQSWSIVGLGPDKIIELYHNFNPTLTYDNVYIIGYFEGDYEYFVNSINITSLIAAGSWQDFDASPYIEGDIAALVLGIDSSGAYDAGWRRNGSADNYPYPRAECASVLVGVDANKICELYKESTVASRNSFRIEGWISKNVVIYDTIISRVVTEDTWEDFPALPVGAIGGIYRAGFDSYEKFGIRPNGSLEAGYSTEKKLMHQSQTFVGLDASRIAEGYLQYDDLFWYEEGYFTEANPAISSTSLITGCSGDSITIEGSNFGAVEGSVKFNGVDAAITSWSDTEIVCDVPPSTNGDIVVYDSSGNTSEGVFFSYGSNFVFITPTDVTPVALSAWTDVDASAFIPAEATGVILHFNATAGSAVGWKADGSTDNIIKAVALQSHFWTMCKINALGIFELYVGANVVVYVTGYTLGGVIYYTNRITLSTPTVGGYADYDLSTLSPNITGAVLEINGASLTRIYGVRANGSADAHEASMALHSSAIIGAPSGVFEYYKNNADVVFTLIALITDGCYFYVNSPEYTVVGEDAWEDMAALPVDAIGAFFETNVYARSYGFRKDGSVEDIKTVSNIKPFGIVECSAAKIVEGYRNELDVDWWLVGYPLEINCPTVTISTLAPTEVCKGQLVTITGTDFGAIQGTITINGAFAEVILWSDTLLIMRVPLYATSGDVIVITSAGVSSNAVSLIVNNCVILYMKPLEGLMSDFMRSDFSRVFLLKHKAGPTHTPEYEGWWRAGALSWDQGDVTPVYAPSETAYGDFKVLGKVPGEPSSPEIAIGARYQTDLSELLKLVRDGCDHDIQVHFGKCRDPRDFNGGWEKVLILEGARLSAYGTDDLGAFEPSQRAAVNENVTFIGEDAYEIKRLVLAEMASSTVTNDINAMTVCDSKTCGTCGVPSDGCDVVLAVTGFEAGSPGLTSKIIYTKDGFASAAVTEIDTLAATEEGIALACVGTDVVVVSSDSDSIHIADLSDLLLGTETWVEVTTGFVATKGPIDIFTLGPSLTWFCGEGGYIYFTSKPSDGVAIQSAGVVTTQDLLAIHGYDMNNIISVGKANALIHTANGGETWELITGPAPAVQLNTCWMSSLEEWWVGTDAGKLYFTIDGGVNWTEKTFSGSGVGKVHKIAFTTPSVGYMIHNTVAVVGRILRTIDGGYSWYVLPEGTGTVPTNLGLFGLAVCSDPNKVFAGGLGTGTDGIIIEGA